MTLVVPTVPVLPAGYTVQAADLNQLAAVATFLLGKPYAHIADQSGGTSIATVAFSALGGTISLVGCTTATINNGTSGSIDTDGMWTFGAGGTGNFLTVQTPGWYIARVGIRVTVTSGDWLKIWPVFVPGLNNPVQSFYSSGVALYPNQASTDGGDAITLTAGGLSPFPLYPGDEIAMFGYCDTGTMTSAISGAENGFLEAEWVGSA